MGDEREGTSYNILIVDDDVDVLRALERNLSRAKDFTSVVETANNGEEALTKLAAQDFALVISDFKMPGMSGVDLLKLVKERYPATVRALITGYSDVSIAREAINRAKIDHYMEKPWDRDEIRSAVKGLLELYEFKRRVDITPDTEQTAEGEQRFSLEPGYIYMVEERKGMKSFEILSDLVTHGRQGLGITIQSPKILRQKYGFEKTRIVYLGKEQHGDEWVDASDIVEIGIIIRSFLEEAENGVVVIDGIEYLISCFSFDTIVKLIQNLYEFNTFNGSVIIFPVNPKALERKELAILERYFEPVEGEGE